MQVKVPRAWSQVSTGLRPSAWPANSLALWPPRSTSRTSRASCAWSKLQVESFGGLPSRCVQRLHVLREVVSEHHAQADPASNDHGLLAPQRRSLRFADF